MKIVGGDNVTHLVTKIPMSLQDHEFEFDKTLNIGILGFNASFLAHSPNWRSFAP